MITYIGECTVSQLQPLVTNKMCEKMRNGTLFQRSGDNVQEQNEKRKLTEEASICEDQIPVVKQHRLVTYRSSLKHKDTDSSYRKLFPTANGSGSDLGRTYCLRTVESECSFPNTIEDELLPSTSHSLSDYGGLDSKQALKDCTIRLQSDQHNLSASTTPIRREVLSQNFSHSRFDSTSFITSTPPATNPSETNLLWAQVMSSIDKSPNGQQAILYARMISKKTPAYREKVLEPRRISIIKHTGPNTSLCLPDSLPDMPEVLGVLYVDPSRTGKVVSEVKAALLDLLAKERTGENNNEAIYRQFLPSELGCGSGQNRTVNWVRHDHLLFSFKSRQAILLPPQSVEDHPGSENPHISSYARDPDSRTASVSSKQGSQQSKPQASKLMLQASMKPDAVYVVSFDITKQPQVDWLPGGRTMSVVRYCSPYLLVEYKSKIDNETEAHQPLALLGSMLLLERVKLRSLSSNQKLDDLKVYILTCCGNYATVYRMTILTGTPHVQPKELLKYQMVECHMLQLIFDKHLEKLINVLNRIHLWGTTEHYSSLQQDIEDANDFDVTRALEHADTHCFRYKGFNEFEVGEELVKSSQYPTAVRFEDISTRQPNDSNMRRQVSVSDMPSLVESNDRISGDHSS